MRDSLQSDKNKSEHKKKKQVWPREFEDHLTEQFPQDSGNIGDDGLSLAEYVKMICAICDIPVHSDDTIIQSLHVLYQLHTKEFMNIGFPSRELRFIVLNDFLCQ